MESLPLPMWNRVKKAKSGDIHAIFLRTGNAISGKENDYEQLPMNMTDDPRNSLVICQDCVETDCSVC